MLAGVAGRGVYSGTLIPSGGTLRRGFDPHAAWSLASYSQDWPECSGSHGCSSPEPQPVGGKINTASQAWDELQRHRPGAVIIVNVQTWLAALESGHWSWEQIAVGLRWSSPPETEQLGRALMREEPLTRRGASGNDLYRILPAMECSASGLTAKLKDWRETHEREIFFKRCLQWDVRRTPLLLKPSHLSQQNSMYGPTQHAENSTQRLQACATLRALTIWFLFPFCSSRSFLLFRSRWRRTTSCRANSGTL